MAALTVPQDARDEARFHEQIAQQHRQWVAYLNAQLQLLAIQSTRSRVAFESAESHDADERAARATLAGLSPALRSLFDAVIERERQEIQRRLLAEQRPVAQTDPDEAIRLALQGLHDDATGQGRDGGRGLLPRGTPDEIRWYEVDTAVLQALPTAATYAAATGVANPRRLLMTIGGALAVVLLLVIWMLLPRAAPASTGPQPVRVNATPVTLWPIELAILETATERHMIPLTQQSVGAWPAPVSAGGTTLRGARRTTSLYPLYLCIPGEALREAMAMTLPAQADRPARRYTLSAERPHSIPDLVVEPCSGDVRLRRYGMLRAITPIPDQPVGQALALPSGSQLRVERITLIGGGQDPTLPAGQARVAVLITSTAALDWPTLAPTLFVPSGTALLPSETLTHDTGVELRYLVPEPAEPLPVAWSITPDPAQPVLRWRALLPPPPDRQAILRDTLDAIDVQAGFADTPGMIRVRFLIINRGTAALALTPETIQLVAQERAVGTPDPGILATPLLPGEQRAITIDAPEQPRLLLTVGIRRFAIQP